MAGRISGSNVDTDAFGTGKHGFRVTDATTTPVTIGTTVSATWIQGVEDEICGLIENAGLTLSGSDNTQLRAAAIDTIQTEPYTHGLSITNRTRGAFDVEIKSSTSIDSRIELQSFTQTSQGDNTTFAGNILGQLCFGGYDGTDFVDSKAIFKSVATETQGTLGGDMHAMVTPSGSTTPSVTVQLDEEGHLTAPSLGIQVSQDFDYRVLVDDAYLTLSQPSFVQQFSAFNYLAAAYSGDASGIFAPIPTPELGSLTHAKFRYSIAADPFGTGSVIFRFQLYSIVSNATTVVVNPSNATLVYDSVETVSVLVNAGESNGTVTGTPISGTDTLNNRTFFVRMQAYTTSGSSTTAIPVIGRHVELRCSKPQFDKTWG